MTVTMTKHNEHTVACDAAIKAWRQCPDTFAHQVDAFPNWGGGWNWTEYRHPLLPQGYRVDAWLHGTLSLSQSVNHNRRPIAVAHYTRDAAAPGTGESLLAEAIQSGTITVSVCDEGKPPKTLTLPVIRRYPHHMGGIDCLVLDASSMYPGMKGCTCTVDVARSKTLFSVTEVLQGVFRNRKTLQKYVAAPKDFADKIRKDPNWGGGWNWVETFHPSQDIAYGVRLAPGIGDLALTWLYPSSSPHTFAYFARSRKP
jgi:hypothetical protein